MNRTTIVTGAGNGIGAAIAQRFAQNGTHVVVTDIDMGAANAVAMHIQSGGGLAIAAKLDVSSEASWSELADLLHEQDFRPQVIVNNAFFTRVVPAHELTQEDWNHTLAVSLGSVYLSVKTFHESLVTTHGSIVNVSSVHALLAWPGHPAYAAAKGGVVALTRQLSLEYAPEVRVNAVLPGSIQTRVWDDLPEAAREQARQLATLKRMGKPDEVAEVVEFLASERASYITGAALAVDGGMSTTVVA